MTLNPGKLFVFSVVLFCSGCGSSAFDVPGVGSTEPELVFTGVHVVDPRNGQVSDAMNILVKDGKIVAVTTSAQQASATAKVIDASGKFVVPGFLEMHAHPLDHENADANLALMLVNGITGYRQMSGSSELLEQRQAGKLDYPELAPELLAMPGVVLTPFNAGSVEEVRATVANQVAAGADFIKAGLLDSETYFATITEGNKLGIAVEGHVPGDVSVVAASEAGFRSMEHLGPSPGILVACSSDEAGIRSNTPGLPAAFKGILVKLPFAESLGNVVLGKVVINPATIPDENKAARTAHILETFDAAKCREVASDFARNGTWQVPTLVRLRSSQLAFIPEYRSNPQLRYVAADTVEAWNEVTDGYEEGLDDTLKAVLQESYTKHLQLVKLMADAGVRMTTGSDASGAGWLVAGFALHDEFDELGKAGLSSLQVLQMTTINGAEFLDRTATMGTVEAGKNADLVLLDANPVEDIGNLHKIDGVVRAGVYYSRTDLDTILNQVQAFVNPH